jgi:hypothetical protein
MEKKRWTINFLFYRHGLTNKPTDKHVCQIEPHQIGNNQEFLVAIYLNSNLIFWVEVDKLFRF